MFSRIRQLSLPYEILDPAHLFFERKPHCRGTADYFRTAKNSAATIHAKVLVALCISSALQIDDVGNDSATECATVGVIQSQFKFGGLASL